MTTGGFSEAIQNINTVTVYLNGVAASSTTFTVNSAGQLIFNNAPLADTVITADISYYFRVRFEEDRQDFDKFMGQLWQTGVVKLVSLRPEPPAPSASGSTSQSMPIQTVPYSATPVFNAASLGGFEIVLTGNVTSSSLINAVSGQILVFHIVQDSVGGRTFTWPANVLNAQGPDPSSNSRSVQAFQCAPNGNFYPIGLMTTN